MSTVKRRSRDDVLRIRQCSEVTGEFYDTPKELWGFRLAGLIPQPGRAARAALQANAERLGLHYDLSGLEVRRTINALGSWHVILNQRHQGTRIHRAYVTVHMDRSGSVYMIKNRSVPAANLPRSRSHRFAPDKARDFALRAVRKRARRLTVLSHERVWFPREDSLRYAHKFRISKEMPPEEWIVYVDGETGEILSKYDNLSMATGRARVFHPNPVVAMRDYKTLLVNGVPVRRVPVAAYLDVKLSGLPASGRLSGPHVTTQPTRDRLQRRSLDFSLQSHEHGFEEVHAYYHLDAAIRYVRSLGYTGSRSIFKKPLKVNARATRDNNSWFSPGEGLLCFGTGEVDDAEDGETILHEFGHALQDAICPDFGQSPEAAAMGEGFGDYFAASYFAERKTANRAKRLLPTVMTWDGILDPKPNPKGPPCVRRLDMSVTFKDFKRNGDEHDNGQIWSAALWSIWSALGRDVADRIIIDSHFQLDGFTTMARGARAILDADRNLFGGQHVRTIEAIFKRRAIGPIK